MHQKEIETLCKQRKGEIENPIAVNVVEPKKL
jgi:hypothetical protein